MEAHVNQDRTKDTGKSTSPNPQTPRQTSGAPPSKDQVQGEGNYDAAREFDAAERKWVESGKVEAAARAAAPKSEAERQEMERAEEEARRRAKK